MAGVEPLVTVNDHSVQARLHQGAGGAYLWVTNPTRDSRTIKVGLAASAGNYKSGKDIWGKQSVAIEGSQVIVSVGGRDAAVITLQ